MRLLLAEDDRMIGDSLRQALRLEGHAVDWVYDVAAANAALAAEHFDLLLLDLGLPDKPGQAAQPSAGLGVLRALRSRGDATPVIVLTARDATADRVAGSRRRLPWASTVSARPSWRRATARMRAASSSSSKGLTR